MKMRDGTLLRADIYRPDDGNKYPAILMRTPYNKENAKYNRYMNLFEAVMSGYAVVSQDVRGRFASNGHYEGEDVTLSVEATDGYDSVEWIAGQSWCDGNVGLAGASYNGALVLRTAMENPPHLKAISPWVIGSAFSGNECTLLDGVVALNTGLNWTARMAEDLVKRMDDKNENTIKLLQLLNQAIENPEEIYNFLPLKEVPHFQIKGVREIWEQRILNAVPNKEVAEHLSPVYEKIKVPAFHISGWFDFFTRGTIANFLGLTEKGGSRRARENQYLLVGPWDHSNVSRVLGELDFGPLADVRNADPTKNVISFFNRYLKGLESEIPTVRYFVMGINKWRNSDSWPLENTNWTRFYFHSQGRANSTNGDGKLDQLMPGLESPDVFTYGPQNPIPSKGTLGQPVNGFLAGPLDQAAIEARQDVLCYTTSKLERSLEVTGPLKVHLFASTSVVDTDFVVKVCDVHPDGRSFNVTHGIIRARYRKSIFEPQLLDQGEIYEFVITMGHTSHVFLAGHRIRVDIAGSCFPEFDRNMNTGNAVGEDEVGVPAKNTIYHQSKFASYVELPVPDQEPN